MRKLIGLFLLLLLLAGCEKDKDGDEGGKNELEITSGEYAGYKYTFTPNKGFWAEAGLNTYYFHLVFGATDNSIYTGEDIMSILFYYTGQQSVPFPSPEGQSIQFGLKMGSDVVYYSVDSAVLNISGDPTTDRFIGSMEGDFINQANASSVIHVKMSIDIQMEQL
jgi:hypothetical protein